MRCYILNLHLSEVTLYILAQTVSIKACSRQKARGIVRRLEQIYRAYIIALTLILSLQIMVSH